MFRYRNATASISLLALALAGCNKSAQDMSAPTASPSPGSSGADSGLPPLPAALPMQPGPATPLAVAPPVTALRVRHYVNFARPAQDRDAYAYLDRASDVQDEIGDAPPDYDYRYNDGATPYAWRTQGGDYRYAERGPDGYRYYYYEPGAREPYLVRTHDRSYAYAAGALVAVFALTGALLSHDHYDSYRDEASRYYCRGEDLRQGDDERPHEGVYAADWSQQRQYFSSDRSYWSSARQQQPDWQAYHAQNDPSQRPGWQQEYQQRQQAAQQFNGWQSRGLAGPPPALLAGAGGRGAGGPGQGGDYGRQPGYPSQQGYPGQQGYQRANSAQFGQRHDAGSQQAAPPPNYAAQAAARDQQLAAQRAAAQRQVEANQRQAQANQRQIEASQRQAQANQRQAQANQRQVEAQQRQAQANQRQVEAGQRARDAGQRQAEAAGRAQQQAAAQRQAAAEREQQQAQRNQAEQHALASQRAEQQANRARQQAAMQEQAAANARRQQERAAQEQVAMRQQAQQHEAEAAAHQEQARAQAAQRQAEAARAQVARVQEKDRQKQ